MLKIKILKLWKKTKGKMLILNAAQVSTTMSPNPLFAPSLKILYHRYWVLLSSVITLLKILMLVDRNTIEPCFSSLVILAMDPVARSPYMFTMAVGLSRFKGALSCLTR